MPSVLSKKKRPAGKRRPATRARVAVKDASWPLKESRKEWLRQLRAEYTPAVCVQTLAINESLPVAYGES